MPHIFSTNACHAVKMNNFGAPKPWSAKVRKRAKVPLAPRVLVRKRVGMPVLSVSAKEYCRLLKLNHELELALECKENATRRGTY